MPYRVAAYQGTPNLNKACRGLPVPAVAVVILQPNCFRTVPRSCEIFAMVSEFSRR